MPVRLRHCCQPWAPETAAATVMARRWSNFLFTPDHAIRMSQGWRAAGVAALALRKSAASAQSRTESDLGGQQGLAAPETGCCSSALSRVTRPASSTSRIGRRLPGRRASFRASRARSARCSRAARSGNQRAAVRRRSQVRGWTARPALRALLSQWFFRTGRPPRSVARPARFRLAWRWPPIKDRQRTVGANCRAAAASEQAVGVRRWPRRPAMYRSGAVQS